MLRHATWSKPPISVEVRTSSRLLLVVLQVAMLPLRDRLLPGARPSRLVMTLGMLLLLLLVMLMVIAPDRLLHLRSLLVFVHVLAGMFPSRAKYIGRRQTGTDGSLCVVAHSLAIAKGGRLRLPAMAVTRTCSRRRGSVDGGCRPPARFGRGLNVLNAPEGRQDSRIVYTLFLCFSKCEHLGTELVLTGKVRCFA